MEELQTDPQPTADQPAQTAQSQDASVDTGSSVDNSASGSESILEEANKVVDEITNPLVDAENPEETAEVAEINFDEIKVPENFQLDDNFKSLAQESGLNQETIQKLVDYKIDADSKAAETNKSSFNEVVENLKKETKEMLGANYKQELSYAAKAMNLMSPEDQTQLKEVLNVSGVGNHPMLVKLMITAGKAISEDKMVDGNTTAQPKTTADIMFGDMLKEK